MAKKRKPTDPPMDLKAEEAVLGSCLIDPDAIVRISAALEPEDFYREKNGWIYDAMLTLVAQETPIDFITICDLLQERGYLQEIGPDYITTLVNETPTSLHADHYADIIAKHAWRRRMIHAAGKIGMVGYNQELDPSEAVAEAEAILFEATQQREDFDIVSMKQVMGRLYDELEDVTKRGGAIGIPTGYRDVDNILNGLHRTDMIILAARPSVGKTALALNISLKAAHRGYRVGFISLEMSTVQVGQRALGIETGVGITKIRNAKLDANEWQKVMAGMERLHQLPIYLKFGGAWTPGQLRATARKIRAEYGLDLLIFDYLQLMESDEMEGSRQERVASISRSFKALARDLNIPVIAISQLSRGVESRIDKRPILSDLRESGALEQDADVVIFLYREEMYEADTSSPGLMESIVAKYRHGPTGTAYLHFDKSRGQIAGTHVESADGGLQIRLPV